MFEKVTKKLFGSRNQRLLNDYNKTVQKINALEAAYSALSDAALQQKTMEFRRQVENGTSLDELIPDAFAVVREASKRTLGMRHFDAQLIGGMAISAARKSMWMIVFSPVGFQSLGWYSTMS